MIIFYPLLVLLVAVLVTTITPLYDLTIKLFIMEKMYINMFSSLQFQY